MFFDCTVIALAITLLGVSAEIYTYGTQFIVINIAYIIGILPTTSREEYMLTVLMPLGTPIAAFVFLPVFYQLKLTSIYQVPKEVLMTY